MPNQNKSKATRSAIVPILVFIDEFCREDLSNAEVQSIVSLLSSCMSGPQLDKLYVLMENTLSSQLARPVRLNRGADNVRNLLGKSR